MDLEGKPDGKGSLGKYRRRWANNNKLGLKVTGWVCLQWIHLARGRNQWLAFVKAVKEPYETNKQTNKHTFR
jgi:hypothetical protein